MSTVRASRVVVAGAAAGPVVALDEPLSFWGGFDSTTGRVIDVHHPQHGVSLAGVVVVMASGRGSSSASSVIAEAARRATAPAALVVSAADEIVAIGGIVADELYGRPVPIVEVAASDHVACAASTHISLSIDGTLILR